jgi:SAM-dependent methyltransferase
MRQAEADYWDKVAEAVTVGQDAISDNWEKRQILAQYLLKCRWSGQRVLEIGVGHGVTAATLALSCGRMWQYIGTDLSLKFAESAKRMFKLHVVQADVLSLPAGSFTRILALDSLEHVRPEDRPDGYKAIAERLERGGLLFINLPITESKHEDEFDHGIGLQDLVMLEKSGLRLHKYDHYAIRYGPDHLREYAFAVLKK